MADCGRSLFFLAFWLFADDKTNLGTKVSASGNTVTVEWDRNHPWAAMLAAPGMQLHAEYRTSHGIVSQPISRSSGPSPGDRSTRFDLPASIREEPLGSVCLVIRLASNRILPIRAASGAQSDTARFGFSDWETAIRSNWQRRAVAARLEALNGEIATAEKLVADNTITLGKQGFRSAGECEQLVANQEILIKPYDVVALEKQDEAARRICIKRVLNATEKLNEFVGVSKPVIAKWSADERIKKSEVVATVIQSNMSLVILPVDSLRDLAKGSAPINPLSGKELGEAVQFLKDWDRWSVSSGSYEPQLGTKDEALHWGQATRNAAFRVFGPAVAKALGADWIIAGLESSTDLDRNSVIGAGLDAYTVCVDDNKRQLALKYAAWEQEQKNAPRMAQAKRNLAVQSCREAFQHGDALLKRLPQLKQERVSLQNQIAALQPVPLVSTGKKRMLNQVPCTP